MMMMMENMVVASLESQVVTIATVIVIATIGSFVTSSVAHLQARVDLVVPLGNLARENLARDIVNPVDRDTKVARVVVFTIVHPPQGLAKVVSHRSLVRVVTLMTTVMTTITTEVVTVTPRRYHDLFRKPQV